MLNTRIGSSPALPTSTASSGLDVSSLRRANPKLDEILRDNPGVRIRLEKLAAAGAIVQPAAGDVRTTVDFGMWTHSKKSGGMSQEPFKDIVFVWESDPKGATIDLTQEKFTGKLLGVYRPDQLGYASKEEALRANAKMEVREVIPGVFAHVSSDGGWEWKPMRVFAQGPAATKLNIQWALVDVGANGDIQSGGFPGGWGGRSFSGVHGTNAATST